MDFISKKVHLQGIESLPSICRCIWTPWGLSGSGPVAAVEEAHLGRPSFTPKPPPDTDDSQSPVVETSDVVWPRFWTRLPFRLVV